MKSQNFAVSLLKFSLGNFIRNTIYWPIWWYTKGLALVFNNVLKMILGAFEGLALGVWIANIFKPMYSQYDIASRIISFIMRLIQIIIRSIVMLILSSIFISLFFAYLALPPLTVWMLIYSYKR
jgi:hypothetical protein